MDVAGPSASADAAMGRSACATDQYDVLEVIGKGSFGVVSKIRRKEDGKVFVWKELNYGHMSEKEKLLVVSEVNIIRELRHPFIIRYLDRIVEKHTTKLFIVQEYCENGDLGALIRKHARDNTQIDEEFIWKVFVQLILALKECHRHREASGALKPILHRDLKPGNVFLDKANNIKLGDFGLAKELPSQSKFAYTNVGTPYYMSPELTNEMRYNEKSDIWAVGCLLYELATLRPPFDAKNHLSLAVKINAGKFNRIPDKYSDDLYRAIRWMLSIDQTKRPTVEDLEAVMAPRPVYRENNLIVKEYVFSRKCSVQAREAKAKEDALRARERAVAEQEARLQEWEERLRAATGMGGMAGLPAAATGIKPPSLPTALTTLDENMGDGGLLGGLKRQRRTSGGVCIPDAPPVTMAAAAAAPPAVPTFLAMKTPLLPPSLAAAGAGGSLGGGIVAAAPPQPRPTPRMPW